VTDVHVFTDADELGAALAEEILGAYDARAEGRPFLLGCPGGRSLVSTYRALAAASRQLSDCVIVMMDEYVEDGAPPPVEAHYSCRGFEMREIAGRLGIPEENVWLPRADEPAAYDRRIDRAGGIDLFLLASGASDGHVAFLPPGSRLDGRTAVVRLADTTRRDNLSTFPAFASLSDVPEYGVSVGLATIVAARSVRLVLYGVDKRRAAQKVRSVAAFAPHWPASVVHACSDAEIWLDRDAAA
jgi:glucosamine-6-phosphate deaminase